MLRRTSIAPLALVASLACSSEPTPAKSDAAPASQTTKVADGESAASGPAPVPTPSPAATPTPSPAPTPTPPSASPPAAGEAVPLRLAALREGHLDLLGGHLLMDGEPLVIVGGRVERGPGFARGLEPMLADELPGRTLAFAGDPTTRAAVTTELDFMRGATQYRVYVREGDRWAARELAQGDLVEFYPSLVTRGEALLGLQVFGAGSIDTGSEADEDARDAATAKALGKGNQGFVQLAGSSAPLPRVPKGTQIGWATSSSDGTLYAVAAGKQATLLVWAPDALEPKSLPLPELGKLGIDDPHVTLTSAGDHALVGGRSDAGTPYLAVVRGEAIEVVSKGLSTHADGVLSATRAPSGELWLALGSFDDEGFLMAPEQSLWRRDSGTHAWAPVALPKVSHPHFEGTQGHWFYSPRQNVWSLSELAPSEESGGAPRAYGVAWIAGAAWIVADVGEVAGPVAMLPRRVAFTSAAGNDPPLVLPAFDRTQLEQLIDRDAAALATATPGEGMCETVGFVVEVAVPSTPNLDALALDELGLARARLDAIAAIPDIEDEPKGNSRVVQTFVGAPVGKVDDATARELIVLVDIGQTKHVEPMREAIAAASEASVRAECTPRDLVRMIADYRGG